MICYWFPETTYFFFAEGVPGLLYYSHIPTTIIALLVGLFIFLNNRKQPLNQLLFILCLLFSLWTLTSLILWTNIHSEFLAFTWTIHVALFSFIAVFSVYFVYVFLNKQKPPVWMRTILMLSLAPVLLFGASDLNISGFDIANCDAFIYEGQIYKFYYITLTVLAMLWNLGLLFVGYRRADVNFRKQIVLMGIGMEFFLFMFFSLVFLASYLTEFGFFQDSRLELYGLFGMTFFMLMISILIVRFKTFNVGMLSAQALMVALVILIGSQFTYSTTKTSLILTALTLVLTGISGILLNRSVKKEVKQREQLEVLTDKLEHANERLKELDKLKSEFVSIASHQLRSPLTAIRGYASMLAEGSFGKLPAKAQESAERITESARLMAMSVEDYLNVSRIESGNMKYNYSDFNLKDKVEEITDELRPVALKKNLILLFRTNLKSRGLVHADVGKTVQIAHNLINNSIKYTPKGSVSVFLRDDVGLKKIYLEISDTGVGMSDKTIKSLFQKFTRADNANEVNSSGTGLGLFVASKMAEAMEGTIRAESEGEGKGSTFILELPLAM